ncbi:MJ1255/VC2487 family glycosyltransferase [Vibrio nigripulchritudo]|uniref:MJ1255/VC2487 family glycosyltransferase n=1 Tax=Vibrio nigripulchritudo TaxID=28173 RepID=UPI0003B1BB96|nr:MJ1255/VC2487 family glycosyltransferase [Vibrio nigripulchritudo]CCN71895.1 putative Glycosyl transferase [Vibrio nigripulchritudo SFn118]
MKILYGVQGTGNGHIARARAMAHAFKDRGVEVDFLFSGRDKDKYFSMDAFGDYQTRKGMSFVTQNGKVNLTQTIVRNSLLNLKKEIEELDLSHYDLVINDFEPVSAWAAKQQKVPCIGLSHQNAFRYQVPIKDTRWFDHWIIRYFAPTNIPIGLHWYHFDQQILPPIVHTTSGLSEESGMSILVYLPFESLVDIRELLDRFSHHQFECYHPEIKHTHMIENITFHPLSHDNFQQSLKSCVGVIANGGFELPSEALTLGKKLLLKPLKGQFEQQSNVATLEYLGLASAMDYLDPTAVRNWLDEQSAEKVTYPDVATSIVNWIIQGRWDNVQELWSSLWDQVDYPSYATIQG